MAAAGRGRLLEKCSGIRQLIAWIGANFGKAIAEDMPGFTFDNPLEAISAYGHAFGRVSLIARTSELLEIEDATPAAPHRSFTPTTRSSGS